ncbi:MAG TPA: hypothetical protein VGG19_12130 [Tepidisphaeraceae bacterium]|jgi:hypothetical protein
MRRFKRKFLFKIFIPTVVGVAVAYLLALFFWGIWMPLEPAYQLKNLQGLTPSEVIKRLGTPWNDPRVVPWYASKSTTWHVWKNEEEDGPLYIDYVEGWDMCVIGFHNNQVVSVKFYQK